MAKIFLTHEQVQILCEAMTPVMVCDPDGTPVGEIDPNLMPEYVSEMSRRADSEQGWFTSTQVRRHLELLQEAWDREGGFDKRRMRQILEQIRAADPPRIS